MSVTARKLLGGLTLVAAIGGVWLLWSKPSPFASTETVRAVFADADGLAPIGADVRVAGVPVGHVTGVAREGSDALVTMTLARSAGVVRGDAQASLRPRLMFEGTAYVQLTLGSPSSKPLGGHPLPLSQTSTYVPLAQVMSVLTPQFRGDTHTLASIAAALARRRTTAELRDTLAAAPALSSNAAVLARAAQGPNGSELGTAVRSLSNVSAAAASEAPAIGSMLGSAARTFSAATTENGAPLDAALTALPATVNRLESGAGAAAAITQRAGTLVGDLRPSATQLAPTIAAVRPLLRAAVPVAEEISPELQSVLTVAHGAETGAGPALTAIRALEPTLDIFHATLISALQKKTDLGDPAYLAFLGLFAGGGGASAPFGVDGQGHFMRFGLRFLTGAGAPLPPCTLVDKVAPTLATALESAGGCTP
jgi:ABC-type transporter Mla subunit MlaD